MESSYSERTKCFRTQAFELRIVTATPSYPSSLTLRFLRLTHIPEEEGLCMTSSDHRHARAAQLPAPDNREDLVTLLSDTEDAMYPFFREGSAEDYVKTVAFGQWW